MRWWLSCRILIISALLGLPGLKAYACGSHVKEQAHYASTIQEDRSHLIGESNTSVGQCVCVCIHVCSLQYSVLTLNNYYQYLFSLASLLLAFLPFHFLTLRSLVLCLAHFR